MKPLTSVRKLHVVACSGLSIRASSKSPSLSATQAELSYGRSRQVATRCEGNDSSEAVQRAQAVAYDLILMRRLRGTESRGMYFC